MKLPIPSFGLAGYALAIGLALGALGGWRVTAWINQGHELKAVKNALSAAQTQYQKRIATLTQQVKDGQDAVKSTQDELAAIRARPQPHDPVRLCRNTLSAGLPEVPSGASRVSEATAATGVLPPEGRGNLEEGQDIGPDLRALWDQADELLATCRGAQRILPR